jgi:3-deoxy-manno-octulosonate cytidylyltransferase (CMP-KDO synthetase)
MDAQQRVSRQKVSAEDIAIIIPARYASSRFPGKPLTSIRGADGQSRSLVEWSHRAAASVAGADAVFVATDDERIADAVAGFGGKSLMTPESCRNGTERVAACLDKLPDAEILVNFQGDALLTPPFYVRALIDCMHASPDALVSTVAIECSPDTYRHLAADAIDGRVGGTTVIVNAKGEALYFSKRILPYLPAGIEPDKDTPVLLHLGLYAYRREGLRRYVNAAPTMLETVEGLEQLRFLVHGTPVSVVVMQAPDFAMVEVNNPTDVAIVEGILQARS